MAYVPKPNSFHMNESRLQDAMEKQAKQRMLREQLDSQLAEKRGPGIGGPDLVGVSSSSAAMTATGGLTKVQLKRLQIEKERELETTMNGTMNRGTIGGGGGFGQPTGPGASTPMNGMRTSNVYSTGAFQPQQQQPMGMGYGNPVGYGPGYGPASPSQAPPPPPPNQVYYQQQQFPNGGYSQMNNGYSAPTPVAGAGMGRGGYNQPGLGGNGPAIQGHGGYYGQGMTPSGAAQGSLLPQLGAQPNRPAGPGGQPGAFNNTYTRPSPSPPYEVRDESIYALEESKENKHRHLMSMVSRVAEIDSSAGAGATSSAQVKLKSVVGGQRVQPQQQQRIPPSPREAVEPEVFSRARPGAPAAGAKPRDRDRDRDRDYPVQSPANVSPQGRVSDGNKESGVPRRTDSREPGQRRIKQVEIAEKAKAQRLEKELVNHQNQVEKLREREKDWESQVARLKTELKQARLKEKNTRAQEGAQPQRAETAPNDATKTVKKPHHVKPLDELQAGAGPRPSGAAGGRRHLNDTVKYDDDGSFRPITAPISNDLTSSTGGKSVPSFAQAALPPLLASRDAFVAPTKLDRTAPPPPPPPPPEATTPVSTTSPLSPSSLGSGGPRFLSVENLKSVVTSRVITATQAEALWELLTGRPLSLVPTPPPMPPKVDANAGGRLSQTYTRPQGSMGVRSSANANQESGYNPRTPPPDDIPEAVQTYETFDSFDAGAAPREGEEDGDEEGEEGDESDEEADEEDGSDDDEGSHSDSDDKLQRQYDKAYRDLGGAKQKR